MNADYQDFKHKELSEQVLKVFYRGYDKLKAARALAQEREARLLNYLKATDIEIGLLLNFGTKPEVRRKAFNNSRK